MSAAKEKLIEWLRERITDARPIIETFEHRLKTDPTAALSRSAGVFEAAARLDVFSWVLGALTAKDSKATPETIKAFALDKLRNFAETPLHSSSPTANLMRVCTLSAWAYLYNAFGLM